MLLTFHKIETSGLRTQSGAPEFREQAGRVMQGALGCSWQRPSCRVKTGA
jgi:hypothetical protein